MWTKSSKGVGIVVCNFKKGDIPHAIDLKICDTVVIEQQCQGWYQGFLVNNRAISGIFPSQYVHIKQPCKRSSGSCDEDESVVEELNDTLKEWYKALKKCFVTNTNQQDMVRLMIQAETQKLLSLRRAFTAPYLTRQQKAELRSVMTNKMDWGNKKLGLDVVPRVDGVQVNPDTMSAVELYLIHDSSISTGHMTIRPTQSSPKSKQYNSHHMYMQVKCLASLDNTDELEIYYSLYDAGAAKFISERVMCKLGRGGIIQSTECGEFFTAIFVDLTSADLSLDVYLTAHIYKLSGLRSTEKKKFGAAKNVVNYKRPYGCSAVSVKEVLKLRVKSGDFDEDNQIGRDFSMPLIVIRKDDDFFTITDHLIRRMKEKRVDELERMNVALEVFHGDITTVKHDYPQIFNKKVKVTQKLGFADVIAPEYSAHYVLLENDFRNDFYLNMYECEFERGGKSAEKNVEAKVFVVGQNGEEKKCIYGTGGEEAVSHYETAVFYHSNKPKWKEVIKISLPEHTFRDCHIRIEFRHCSTQGAEKKLFGFTYLPLEDKAGTTVQDRQHSLLVYKATDFKKNSRPHYLDLSFESSNSGSPSSTSNQYCSLNPRDTCYVRTTLCSTKLTQDINLVNLLKWKDPANTALLPTFLRNVQKVNDNELMRHHVDFLNSLFLMTCDVEASQHQHLIFQALVHILQFTKQKNYRQFLPMFELYIEKTFCATLAHRDLLNQIKLVLERQTEEPDHFLLQVIDVLDLLFKFIVRSATLYAGEKVDSTHHILSKGMDDFWKALQVVIEHTKHQQYSAETKISRMSIISRVVDVFPDLIQLLPADKLAKSFSETISLISKRDSHMGEHKLKCLSKLINSPLFEHEDSRRIVLELCNSQLHHCLQSDQYLKLAAQNMSDLLGAVYRYKDTMKAEIEVVVLKLMRVVCETILRIEPTDIIRLLMACLITMLSMVDGHLVSKLIAQQKEVRSVKPFLGDLFKILTAMITKPYIPSDWVTMLMVINSVISKAAQEFSEIVAIDFIDGSCFDEMIWEDFFLLCVKFITQPCLQLEEFSERKANTIRDRYEDMRLEMATLLYKMWITLGEYGENQCAFIPSMIGPFLGVALLPENNLRTTLLPVLNDMLMFKFKEVQGEIVDRLDELYNEGKGDLSFKCAFVKLMTEKAACDSSGRSDGMTHYIDSVSTLIDRLLDYRNVSSGRDDNVNTLMLSTVNLLDFYQNGIKRERLYSHYVYKLRDLNISLGRYTEAGFALLLNASYLDWTDLHQTGDDSYDAEREWERKERHYKEIIQFFDKGQSWEDAIPLCKELATLYETRLFDFVKLANILQRQAELFSNVMPGISGAQPRLPAKYYRVAFYGHTLPFCIRNKSFVYKGDAFTGPGTVVTMLRMEYPNAEQLNESIEEPNIAEINPNKHYFQLVIIEPVADANELFPDSLRAVDYKISTYYQWNRVQKFRYDKPYHYPLKDKQNEHKSLHTTRYTMTTVRPMPGISTWCELNDMGTQTLKPIEVALEALNKKNTDISKIIHKYRDDRRLDQGELSMVLKGSADATVNGGIIMYQRAFLTDDFIAQDCQGHTTKLRQHILEHLRIVSDGLYLFKEIVTAQLRPLAAQLFEEFRKLQNLLKEQDPSFEIVSINSVESGSVISVLDQLGSDSPRASSEYSSSDVESHKDYHSIIPHKKINRKSVSVSGTPSRLRDAQRSSEDISPNLGRRQDGQLVEPITRKSRGSSTFYTPTPTKDITDSIYTSECEEMSSDEDRCGTLKRAATPPPLPDKIRSSSFSAVGTLNLLRQESDSSTHPKRFDLANRPLPDTPSPNQAKPGTPRRTKTMCVQNKTPDLVEYKLPRVIKPSVVPIGKRPPPPLPRDPKSRPTSLEGNEAPATVTRGNTNPPRTLPRGETRRLLASPGEHKNGTLPLEESNTHSPLGGKPPPPLPKGENGFPLPSPRSSNRPPLLLMPADGDPPPLPKKSPLKQSNSRLSDFADNIP